MFSSASPTTRRGARRSAAAFALGVLLSLALFGAACEKNNDLIAQQQIQDSKNACPKGCEIPPPGCSIKGNVSAAGNKFYHTPDQKSWAGIKIQLEKGERWFCNETEALNNGFKKSVN
jgi:hypothetical protein